MTPEIVQIIQEFSTVGGAETVAWELAQAFCRSAITNAVICRIAAPGADPATRIVPVAHHLEGIPTRGRSGYLGRLAVIPGFTFAASRAARRERSAVVISHGDSLTGDVLVVHAVNAESLALKAKGGEWRWRLNPLHLWVALRDRWMIGGRRYHTYVAVSRRVAGELQHHYAVPAERIRVIPNGIDLSRFRPDPAARAAIRREFGIDSETRLLLFVSHEFGRKGLSHVVGALPHLPDARLLVVGSDDPAPYVAEATALGVADRILFAGERRDLPALHNAADVFVLPTVYETFSLVCMEALACGVPVVATPVGGIEDYLVDDVNGWRVDFDSRDIADKIERLFADPAALERIRTAARRTAEAYDWNRIARMYLDLIEEIAAEKRARARSISRARWR